MSFNLLADPWLEVRRASGARDLIRPSDLTEQFDDDPILALDFPRPDWNAAVTEFLIGLCFLVLAPEDAEDWAARFITPPSAQELETLWAPYASAFAFNGDGPRAFQDFDPLSALDVKPLSSLLIDAPGENALRNNSDLFIKRDGVSTLCLPYAAAALITLQTYAPSGGAGHRTSMRGGGPLTTLMAPRRTGKTATTLWDRIWANVPERDETFSKAKPEQVFPWLSPTQTSKNSEIVDEDGNHPALAFFACPRRIRLEFGDDVTCDLNGKTGPGATGFRTQNYGANYLYWRHPLSPYREDKKSGFLPLHPNSGPSDYGDWLAWWGFEGLAAKSIELWGTRRREVEDIIDLDGIEAFGFDMDNMKARQWLNAAFPWIPLHEDAQSTLKGAINEAIKAADETARAVGRYAKIALYGQRQGVDGPYRLPDNLSMDAFREPSERVWRETQGPFTEHLKALLNHLKDGDARTLDLNRGWLETLRREALRIFDETVDLDGLTDAHPRRVFWARDKLSFEFANHSKASVRKALGIAATDKSKKGAA